MWRKKSLKEKAHQRKLKMSEKTMPKIARTKKNASFPKQSGQQPGKNINNDVKIYL